MTTETSLLEKWPLAELVRHRFRALLDRLGSHRVTDLYQRVLGEVERALIEEALTRAKGSRTDAARILGLHRNSLRLRMRALGIESARMKGERS